MIFFRCLFAVIFYMPKSRLETHSYASSAPSIFLLFSPLPFSY